MRVPTWSNTRKAKWAGASSRVLDSARRGRRPWHVWKFLAREPGGLGFGPRVDTAGPHRKGEDADARQHGVEPCSQELCFRRRADLTGEPVHCARLRSREPESSHSLQVASQRLNIADQRIEYRPEQVVIWRRPRHRTSPRLSSSSTTMRGFATPWQFVAVCRFECEGIRFGTGLSAVRAPRRYEVSGARRQTAWAERPRLSA